MIKINCETSAKIKLTDCVPFQGKLKKRTSNDIEDLIKSLSTEGLLMPFAIWKHEDKNYLLDGHGRREALTRMALDDASILSYEWPCIYITADSEDDARKALLQITSQYGKITKQGVKQFIVSIPDYKAPCIQKFVTSKIKINKSMSGDSTEKCNSNILSETIIKIKVANDKVDSVKEILKQFDFIKVL